MMRGPESPPIDAMHLIVQPFEVPHDERVVKRLSSDPDPVERVTQCEKVVRDPAPEGVPDEILVQDSLPRHRSHQLEKSGNLEIRDSFRAITEEVCGETSAGPTQVGRIESLAKGHDRVRGVKALGRSILPIEQNDSPDDENPGAD